KKRRKEAYVLELYIDILLSEILMNIEKEQLIKKIDAAIDEGNKQVFMDLSKQYKELTRRYGT
ncbi:IDEAL domain-containing protein, partial [Bacillus sp. Bva_UNVM-123]|uniref:IDEAL domain-containing protein n=1 Tax=Bacillus sp. Bva_UNVM-123 TaxID=2829798 RepID=UPI00391F4C46